MDDVHCFLLIPTYTVRRTLRRATRGDCPVAQPTAGDWHIADRFLDIIEVGEHNPVASADHKWRSSDSRWPTSCKCGYEFTSRDESFMLLEHLYTTDPDRLPFTKFEAPPGSMWFERHHYCQFCDGDKDVLMVVLPDKTWWSPDHAACKRTPFRTAGYYGAAKCWWWRGDIPKITVEGTGCERHANGVIITDDWRGFLRDGRLITETTDPERTDAQTHGTQSKVGS